MISRYRYWWWDKRRSARIAARGGGAAPLDTPVLAWTSGADDYDPTFSLTEIVEDDVVELQIDDVNTFTSLFDSDTNTIDAAEALSGSLTFAGISTLGFDTTYYARARYQRGGVWSAWSNTVSKVMDAEPVAVSSTRWRINSTAQPSTAYACLAEIQMRTVAAGADQCTGGTPSASSTFDGTFPASNAFDDNNSTLWASANAGGPHWIEYQFAAAKAIIQVVLTGRDLGGFDNGCAPSAFDVQYHDGATWQTLWSASPGDWNAAGGQSLTSTKP